MFLKPTESAVCGISLRTFVQVLVSFDLGYGFLGLGAVVGSFFVSELSPELILNSLLMFTVLTGAVFGMLGLNQSECQNLNKYAGTRMVRIVISVFLTILGLSHAKQTAESQVDAYIAGRSVSEDERSVMVRELTAALIAGLVSWELVTDAASLYFAYVTVSLAEAIKLAPPSSAPLLAGV